MIIPKFLNIDIENAKFYLLAVMEQTVRGVGLDMKSKV